MSKVSNMINMIFMLKDNKIHSMQELSEKLEVTPRMIKQYKDELELAGIYIDSKRGKTGGYFLNQELNNIDVGLNLQDIYFLKKYAEKRCKNNELIQIFDKIFNAYSKNNLSRDKTKIDRILSENIGIEKVYIDMRNSINNQRKVYIEYKSINSGISKRIIHPAELFNYLDDWYIAAFCEQKMEIRLFRLKDIIKYKIQNETYSNERIKK